MHEALPYSKRKMKRKIRVNLKPFLHLACLRENFFKNVENIDYKFYKCGRKY